MLCELSISILRPAACGFFDDNALFTKTVVVTSRRHYSELAPDDIVLASTQSLYYVALQFTIMKFRAGWWRRIGSGG